LERNAVSYWYLGTPYSKWPKGVDDAYAEACKQAAILLRAGVNVLSPIAATHGVALHGKIDPKDHRIWLPLDRHFMEAAQGIIVCMMDGWDQSVGVTYEIEYFEHARKPIVYMLPGSVPEIFVPEKERML
jgi:hypothetical protein